jgi:uncharacterized protein YaiI (UPF0178 family)
MPRSETAVHAAIRPSRPYSMAMPNIYIDGDACPVKDEIVKGATRYGLAMYMVSNQGTRPRPVANYHVITVGTGFDAADDWIVEHIEAADIAITADILLAARCLEKGASALAPTGQPFTADNIGNALAMRSLSQYLREAGEMKGNNPSFTRKDRSQFLQALDNLIQKLRR